MVVSTFGDLSFVSMFPCEIGFNRAYNVYSVYTQAASYHKMQLSRSVCLNVDIVGVVSCALRHKAGLPPAGSTRLSLPGWLYSIG